LDKNWLMENPDVLDWNVIKYFDRVHADGGYIVHAHPFRENVDIVKLMPGKVDAIEVVNGGRSDVTNRYAHDFAESFALPQTAGSDIHSTGQKRLCGVITRQRLRGGGDYMAAVLARDITIIDENLD